MNSITLELSRGAGELTYGDLPGDVVHWAKVAITDTVGAVLAGAREPAVNLVGQALGIEEGGGVCRVLGRPNVRTSALNAALLNGVAGHVNDFDDCSIIMDGHPTVPIVPALLALAERLDRTGQDVIEAYVSGFEVEVHIARYLNGGELKPADFLPIGERGWHPTSVLGTLGCAIACGRLLKLSVNRMATALAIAASSASGLRGNSGTMTKSLHVGHANRNGLLAALLASQGFTANTEVLEHKFGFFQAYNGPGTYGTYTGIESFGKTFELAHPGVSIKPYPCCSYTFPAIDAALELARKHELAAGDVEDVHVRMHERCIGNVNRPAPNTWLDAKFSTQYVTARALIARQVVLEDFEGAFDLADTQDLMNRVRLETHTEEDLFRAYVDITLKDGSRLSAMASTEFGRNPDSPMPESEFKLKFTGCATRSVSRAAAELLYERFKYFEEEVSVRDLLNITDCHDR